MSSTRPIVVVVQGEQDQSNVAALAASLATATSSGADVSVDFSRTTFASASTVRALLNARQAMLERNSVLTVRSPSPAVERLLQLCGVEWLIDGSGDDAAASRRSAVGR